MHGLFLPPDCSLLSISSLLWPPSMGIVSNMTNLASNLHISREARGLCYVWLLPHINCVGLQTPFCSHVPLFTLSELCLWAQLTQIFFLLHHVCYHLQLPCGTCNIPVAVTPKPVFSILQSEQLQKKYTNPLRYPYESLSSIPGSKGACTQKLCRSSQNDCPYSHSN